MRVDDGHVIPPFIRQALQGNDLTVDRDGSQTRRSCYVDDLIDGFVHLVRSDVDTSANIGNPGERTIL